MPPGDSGFKETTEGVSAKLNVEVPEQALTTLTALAKQTEAYRISMEAAARSQGDHKDYLEKIPVIAEIATQKLGEWCDQVERAIDLKGKLGDFGSIPGAVGQDSANPFGNATLGRGDLAQLGQDPARVVSMGAQRGMVDREAVGGMSDEQIKKLADALTNAVGGEDANDGGGAARPRVPGKKKSDSPDEDQGLSPRAMEEQAMKGRDLFGQVLGEMGPGSSMGDMVGAGRDMLGRMEGAGGMLGKLGAALGPVGAGVGLALTANQLLQMGGERIQDYRNLGSTTGGGVSEGMRYDAQAKMLALDPFITTAQAREVIQGALNGGMGGDQFDSVTGFIAKNLKDMNMAVGDSVKLLQENVESGGMSIDQLGASLANIKAMASGSAQSQGEITAAFGTITSQMTNLGVSGQQGDIATQFIGSFSDSPLLAPVAPQLSGALANPNFASQVAQTAAQAGVAGMQGVTPRVAMQKLAKSGQLNAQTMKTLEGFAKMAQRSNPDPDMAVEMFVQICNQQGFAIGVNEARGLYEKLISPNGAADLLNKGVEATQAGVKPIDTGFMDASMSGLSTLGTHVGNLGGGLLEMGKDLLTFNWTNLDDTADAVMKRKGEIDRQHEADAGMYTTETLKGAVAQYGADNLKVYDAQGKNPQKLDQANREQRDKLIAGELLIAPPGQSPTSLSKFGTGNAAAGVVGQQNVQVSASPIVVRYEGPISGPQAVPLTTNQMQSNAGYGGATDNNAPVGNR